MHQGLHSNGVYEAGGQQLVAFQYPQGVNDDAQQNLPVGPIPLSLRIKQGSQQQETGREWHQIFRISKSKCIATIRPIKIC